MADCFRVNKQLVIIATFRYLVAEEVNFFKAFVVQKLEAIRFIPAYWIDVDADLTA